MSAQVWLFVVLVSTAAVCSCTAEGPGTELPVLSGGNSSAAAGIAKTIRTVNDRNSSSSADASILSPVAGQHADKIAGNATATAAPIPAEPASASSAGNRQQSGSGRHASSQRSRRPGLAAARRAGLRAAAGRRLGQRLHARPAMHNRCTAAAAAPAGVTPASKDTFSSGLQSIDSSSSSSSSSSSTGTASATPRTTAVAQQQQTSMPDRNKLQSENYFRITDMTGRKAIHVGTTLTWQEDQLLRPANDSASGPSDWKLVKVDAGSGEQQSETGGVVYWVTSCGYLQWLKGRKEVKYTAEVDGCSDVINYAARRRDKPDLPAQFGTVLIMVGEDSCLYSHCEQPGCSHCKCLSRETGECGCGDPGTTGFISYYNWAQNSHSCVYKEITAAPPGSSSSSGRNNNTAPVLYEARRGSGNIVIPIRFGNAPQCLKARASRCLEVRSVKCSQSSSSKDADMKVVQAKAASRTATAGTLQGGCNSAHGTYLVVVGLPSAAGRYRCSVTFNDDWENRPLANLRVT